MTFNARHNATHQTERLKDRHAYRATLIQKAEDIEKKIKAVEKEIGQLVQGEQK